MRDCLFLVADKNMEGMVKGFFSRDRYHLALDCGPFAFEANQDLLVAHGLNDPGLYTRANELLRSYKKTHRHAVVMIDAEWDGSPGSAIIDRQLRRHLEDAGWQGQDACAVVIDPELENWVWQDNLHLCKALAYEDFSRLKQDLESQNFWSAENFKPQRPKEALEWALRKAKKPRSSSLYQQLAAQVSIRNCADSGFLTLLTALRGWFPVTQKR